MFLYSFASLYPRPSRIREKNAAPVFRGKNPGQKTPEGNASGHIGISGAFPSAFIRQTARGETLRI
jgi:hypothetical protein